MAAKKKKEENSIQLDPRAWLDDIAWWAMRYCICRNTYANDTWKTILSTIEHYPNQFRNERNLSRLKFFARDIRSEISGSFAFTSGIDVEGSYNSVIQIDAYSLLATGLEENDKVSWNDYDFEIDCVEKRISPNQRAIPRSKSNDSSYTSFPRTEFEGWIKLANSIDNRYRVTVSNGVIEETNICVQVPVVVDKNVVGIRWSKVDRLDLGYYLPEYIKEAVYIGTDEK